MSNIEIVIGLLLLFMAVPDACRRIRRPALAYPCFVLFGWALQVTANSEVATMLHQAGAVGFLMLLFEVGLEIDLPKFRDLVPAARFALPWIAIQFPAAWVIASLSGLGAVAALFSAAALLGVSVGMAYPAWKGYPGLDPATRARTLQVLILLEIVSVILLAAGTPALREGLSWDILFKLAGIAVTLLLVSRFASHLTRAFQTVLERATHWRTHLLVLLVLAVCAVGERLGLSAAKTAFFLGLFMSRAEHHGRGLEEFTAPVSQRFLIPIFFVSLGLRIDWSLPFSMPGVLALGSAALFLGIREIVHRRWLPLGKDRRAFLLLCPNLTLVALAATALLEAGNSSASAGWLLLTGLYQTIASVALLPSTVPNAASPLEVDEPPGTDSEGTAVSNQWLEQSRT